ncbi:MAG: hypothetical protein ACI9YR_002029, partial [Bacteroidia bacterium]
SSYPNYCLIWSMFIFFRALEPLTHPYYIAFRALFKRLVYSKLSTIGLVKPERKERRVESRAKEYSRFIWPLWQG